MLDDAGFVPHYVFNGKQNPIKRIACQTREGTFLEAWINWKNWMMRARMNVLQSKHHAKSTDGREDVAGKRSSSTPDTACSLEEFSG